MEFEKIKSIIDSVQGILPKRKKARDLCRFHGLSYRELKEKFKQCK